MQAQGLDWLSCCSSCDAFALYREQNVVSWDRQRVRQCHSAFFTRTYVRSIRSMPVRLLFDCFIFSCLCLEKVLTHLIQWNKMNCWKAEEDHGQLVSVSCPYKYCRGKSDPNLKWGIQRTRGISSFYKSAVTKTISFHGFPQVIA